MTDLKKVLRQIKEEERALKKQHDDHNLGVRVGLSRAAWIVCAAIERIRCSENRKQRKINRARRTDGQKEKHD